MRIMPGTIRVMRMACLVMIGRETEKEQFKSLLENACMIEFFAEISELQ